MPKTSDDTWKICLLLQAHVVNIAKGGWEMILKGSLLLYSVANSLPWRYYFRQSTLGLMFPCTPFSPLPPPTLPEILLPNTATKLSHCSLSLSLCTVLTNLQLTLLIPKIKEIATEKQQ